MLPALQSFSPNQWVHLFALLLAVVLLAVCYRWYFIYLNEARAQQQLDDLCN